LSSGEEIYIKIPDVSLSRMKISDIGFQADPGIVLSATLSEDLSTAEWIGINNGDNINKTINIIKAKSNDDSQRLILRVIMC